MHRAWTYFNYMFHFHSYIDRESWRKNYNEYVQGYTSSIGQRIARPLLRKVYWELVLECCQMPAKTPFVCIN